jgi:hypothetical protein
MNGEVFTRQAQRDFPDGFHSNNELAEIINQSALAIDRGSGHVGSQYPGDNVTKTHWQDSMGEDPESVNEAKLLAETEDLILSWTKVTTKALSIPPPSPKPLMEYSWMLGGKCIPLVSRF